MLEHATISKPYFIYFLNMKVDRIREGKECPYYYLDQYFSLTHKLF